MSQEVGALIIRIFAHREFLNYFRLLPELSFLWFSDFKNGLNQANQVSCDMAVSENTGYLLKWFKLKDVARNLYECVICLEVVKDAMQVRDCGHLFCRYCIERVLKYVNSSVISTDFSIFNINGVCTLHMWV